MQLPRKHRDEALLGEIIEQVLAVREFLYSPLLGKVPPPAIFSLVSQGNMCDHSANPTLKAEASWPVATSLPQRSMSIPNVISPLVKKQHMELRVDTRPCTWKRVLNCFNHVKCCQSSALLDNDRLLFHSTISSVSMALGSRLGTQPGAEGLSSPGKVGWTLGGGSSWPRSAGKREGEVWYKQSVQCRHLHSSKPHFYFPSCTLLFRHRARTPAHTSRLFIVRCNFRGENNLTCLFRR